MHISIHAAREGGDIWDYCSNGRITISIHAAREGGDDKQKSVRLKRIISIHAAREGGDSAMLRACPAIPHFNPRRP